MPGTRIPNRAFRFLVSERYSIAELKILCHDVGVDWEEIPGDGKTERIVELTAYCRRNKKLEALLRTIDADTNGGISKYGEPSST